jgi:uncharacterized protein (DUF427 family)
MPKAIWNGVVLAESDKTTIVEGNHYFPHDSVNWEYFLESNHTSVCPWKGNAGYYDIEVDGQVNRNAAWYYAQPSAAASRIKDHVAFWRGVQVM